MTSFSKFFITFALSLFTVSGFAEESAPLRTDHLRSQLLSSQSEVVAGQPFWVGLRLQHDPQWHTYWKVSGDAGLPTEIKWTLPAGWRASAIHWPVPQRISEGNLTTFALADDTLLLVQITPAANAPPGAVNLSAQANWLICHDVCIPGQGEYPLKLNVGSTAKAGLWHTRLQRAQQALPKNLSGWRADAQWRADGVVVQLRPQQGQPLPAVLEYFPHHPDLIANAKPQSWVVRSGVGTLTIPAAENKTRWGKLDGVLVADGGAWAGTVEAPIRGARAVAHTVSLTPSPSPEGRGEAGTQPLSPRERGWGEGTTQANSTAATSTDSPAEVKPSPWLTALLGAFLGGLILNLMPCVFPVLSIKIVSIVQHEARHPGVLHRHGLLYTAGVMLGFLGLAALLLAARAAGAELGWGFQLQNPWFVLALAALFILIALNLFGVFEIRWGQTRAAAADHAAQQQAQLHPHLSAFATGLLAVVVASPCSAPFMGAALGFALTQPTLLALLVFAMLGLGLALPYLVLCYSPGLLKRLPKSGAWMEHFKQFLALPMLATVGWLLWVYGLQTSLEQQGRALLALCGLTIAVWAWGRHQRRGRSGTAPTGKTWLVFTLLVLSFASYAVWRSQARMQSEASIWQPYSESAMQSALAQNKTVFVDFTAAWCISCQVNKKAVLETEAVKQALAASGIVLLRADWTKPDPAISAALHKLGRNGIPVYWLQRPGQPPVLLPEVLTRDILLSALKS